MTFALRSMFFLALCTTAAAQPARSNRSEVSPRKELPAAIAPLVPKHGIYAAGGGLTSSSWRVVVDFDKNTIYGGSTPKQSAKSYEPQTKATTKPLAKADRERLIKLANDAWAEKPPTTTPRPTADYDELLIVADGNDVFYLDGYGPIRRTIAAKAIAELRARAGL